MSPLTGKQRHHLRGMGHALSPVVQIAALPLSDGVLAEIDRQLATHELIKLKLALDEREERRDALAEVLAKTGAEEVQQIGKTALVFRPNPEHKKPIRLPARSSKD